MWRPEGFSSGPQEQSPTFFVDPAGNAKFNGNLTVLGAISESGGASGVFEAANGTAAAPSFTFVSDPTTGFYRASSTVIGFSGGGVAGGVLYGGGIEVVQSATLAWSSTASPLAAPDIVLLRDAAGTLALKNGANGQSFRIYQSDGANYLLLAGTTVGFIATNNNVALQLGVNNGANWNIIPNGHFTPILDNTYAIGDATHRASNIFSVLGTFGLATNLSGVIYAGANGTPSLTMDGIDSGSQVNFRSASGTQAARTIVVSGNANGSINAWGWNGTGYDLSSQIIFRVNGTPGASGDMPGSMEFYNSLDGSATPTLALTIDNTKLATFASSVRVSADIGAGAASTLTLTSAVNTTLTNAYVVKGGQAATTANSTWLKVYTGTTVAWVPAWINATP